MGRPSTYTPEIGALFCERLAASTVEGVPTICDSDERFPHPSNIYRWLDEFPAFREGYARAMASRAENLAAESFEIVDDGRNDWMEARGGYVVNGEALGRSKLRADFRLRVMETLDPSRWGKKQQVELSGGLNLTTKAMSDAELLDAVQGLISRGLMPGVRPDEEVTLAADDASDLL